MKNTNQLRKTDVDLNSLQFFNHEEFNKFISKLLNQDTLDEKARIELYNKIEKTFQFYETLKKLNASEDIAGNKQAQINSLLSSNGFSSQEELEESINNELSEITNILNQKTEQMGLYIIDHSSVINDEINQRVEELSDSANEKLSKTEKELVMLQSALSDNANYIESEIERKTEKLGNEIQNMTSTVSPSTQLAVIRPRFSDILKRVFSERNIAKKNYKFATKNLKGSYPAPKSLFRCVCEAYFEYADEKDIAKNSSHENIQNKIKQKSQKTKEIKNFLASLQNKATMELEKVKRESNLALEILPALNKLITTSNDSKVVSIQENINNIKNKNFDSYTNFLNQLGQKPQSQPTLKLVVDNSNNKKNISDIIEQPTENATTSVIPNLNEELKTKSNETTEITSTNIKENNNDLEKIPVNALEENVTSSIFETNLGDMTIKDIKGNDTSCVSENKVEASVPATELQSIEKEELLKQIIKEEITTIKSEMPDENTAYSQEENKSEAIKELTDTSSKEKASIVPPSTPSTLSKEELEKTRIKTQQKLQKAQEKFDKVTNKAQEQLERANAKAQLEINRMKNQAIEILRLAIDTANNIINDANERSIELVRNANTSSEEMLNIANQTSKSIIIKADNASKQVIINAKTQTDNMRTELENKSATIIAEAENKSNSVIITANKKSEELLNTAQTKSSEILNNIETEIKNRKNKIDELKTYIINNKADITTLNEKIKISEQKIKKIETLMATAKNMDGMDEEIKDFENKQDMLKNYIVSSTNTIEQLKTAIDKANSSIDKLSESIPTLRPTLEKKAQTILENAKLHSTQMLEKAQAESKRIRQNANIKANELKEEVYNKIETILTQSRIDSEKIKEDAKTESIRIIEQANKKAKLMLESAQIESKKLKEQAEIDANELKESKKSELTFILSEEEIKKVC